MASVLLVFDGVVGWLLVFWVFFFCKAGPNSPKWDWISQENTTVVQIKKDTSVPEEKTNCKCH